MNKGKVSFEGDGLHVDDLVGVGHGRDRAVEVYCLVENVRESHLQERIAADIVVDTLFREIQDEDRIRCLDVVPVSPEKINIRTLAKRYISLGTLRLHVLLIGDLTAKDLLGEMWQSDDLVSETPELLGDIAYLVREVNTGTDGDFHKYLDFLILN